MADPLVGAVAELLRHTARTEVVPRFRRLISGDVHEKAPGELVTVADRAAEKVITEGLRELLPGSVVVGEEGVAEDPSVLDRLHDAGAVWVVDPLDGTANFAAGRAPFVMMVALLRDGVTDAGWILDPRADSLAWALRGRGAYVDDRVIRTDGTDPVLRADDAAGARGNGRPAVRGELRGVVSSRFLPDPLAGRVRERSGELGQVLPGQHCAGREYFDIASGDQDFALFWRTLPWDHAAGVLLIEEAGGLVRRLDGDPYASNDDLERHGLLAAASEPIWREVRDTLFRTGEQRVNGGGSG